MPTLEQLDGEDWGEPTFPSGLVIRCHQLRKKELDAFTAGDLRVLIGQGMSLKYLMPKALALLCSDPLTEGDLYPGDLLRALIFPKNWSELAVCEQELAEVCNRARALIESRQDETLADGRFVGDDLAATLQLAIKEYQDR
ncbi:MAG TPA: hypothetical protein DHW63_02170 [Hyphomonadaceae bacterium]|nr:hypothetical protein [Hyphomonadaceae bacterium]